MARALQRQRSHRPRRAASQFDGAQLSVGDREQPQAVGLDDVRLVHAGFLHVGGRVVGNRGVPSAGVAAIGTGTPWPGPSPLFSSLCLETGPGAGAGPAGPREGVVLTSRPGTTLLRALRRA